MNLAQRMKRIWNNVTPREAHFGISGEKEEMFARYKKEITDHITVTGKTIVDYGCGGALLGLYLLSNFKIKKYIAYDLSDRSIKKASENLKGFDNKELNLVPIPHQWGFSTKKPDIIVCLACIIHFPTLVYLNNFLKECNESKAKYLVLEIRDIERGTAFQRDKDVYTNIQTTVKACFTNKEYLKGRLTNYQYIRSSEKFKSNCLILTFKRNKDII